MFTDDSLYELTSVFNKTISCVDWWWSRCWQRWLTQKQLYYCGTADGNDACLLFRHLHLLLQTTEPKIKVTY